MVIREANSSDIPAIVKVLKLSLGEQELPLSESIWNFKHVNNPFGKSLVFVAEEGNMVVGVRAFMRWQWKLESEIYNTYRAVDTATHPEHQGKGIFKKLTLKAVEVAKENGNNFIFNTPNEQSRPGYLKMGWEVVDKLRVALKPALISFWKIYSFSTSYNSIICSTDSQLNLLCNIWNQSLGLKKSIYTPKSVEYLKWRYLENPLQEYEVFTDESFFIAGYIKKRKGMRELRISECIFQENSNSYLKITKVIRQWSLKFGAQVISYSPEFLSLNFTFINANIGPILTFKELNLVKKEKSLFKEISHWSYSLGDLELF